jgi:hypothetical protein
MRIEVGAAISLRAVIEHELASIQRLTESLQALGDRLLGEHDVIAAGYYLHSLYSALENIFDQTSRTFENHIADPSRWHRELLEKMTLDLSPLRPAVLPAPLRPLLDDLRGFRHRFRHGYDYPLDAEKVQELRQRWLKGGAQVCAALRAFAEELGRAASWFVTS